MSTNRLKLDWTIEWREDRNTYVQQYLDTITFTPNEEELDMLAKYILWGKNRLTGLNGRQEGLDLETRAGTWDARPIDSLEELMDTPGFNEASILPNDLAPTRIIKETFSRKDARERAPSLRSTFEELWRNIDEVEVITSFYDLAHGKRNTPIRPLLLKRFQQEELDELRERSQHLSSYQYLKLRHRLVELRRQQYTLRDSYAPTILSQSEPSLEKPDLPWFGEDIEIRPLGMKWRKGLEKKVWNGERFPKPDDFSPEEQKEIVRTIWQLNKQENKPFFDFCDTQHLYELCGIWGELEANAAALGEEFSEESAVREFLAIARTYMRLAKLEPMHREILELKLKKKTNQEIVEEIKKKFGKEYKVNYISTLYCNKCLVAIAEAARDHLEVMENIVFPENFKRCKDCGKVLLLSEKNFVRRHRSNDGFAPRCKGCEKIKREERKKK